ncbi:MAG TPA: GNAT family N-acetyltransferase [Solirubrobacteraceae bacterium]|nr:GNAT family N-acetyltransferase [Solirubrobacteraceae bacterium]
MSTLETKRLVGEPASKEHRDFVVTLFGDPEVAKWIWPRGREGSDAVGPRTPVQSEEMLLRFVADWRRHGFGWWYLRERASGELVGDVCLQRTEVEGEPAVEIGWTLLPARWGRGYATEAARAALAYGFETAGLDEVVSFTMPHNRASRRVMEKLGMEYDRDFERAGLPHVLYRLAAPGPAC